MKLLTIGYDKIPFADRMQIDCYFEGAIKPSSDFILAILKNDLRNAIQSASPIEAKMLSTYVDYIEKNAPRGSWGSMSAVKNWLKGYY